MCSGMLSPVLTQEAGPRPTGETNHVESIYGCQGLQSDPVSVCPSTLVDQTIWPPQGSVSALQGPCCPPIKRQVRASVQGALVIGPSAQRLRLRLARLCWAWKQFPTEAGNKPRSWAQQRARPAGWHLRQQVQHKPRQELASTFP